MNSDEETGALTSLPSNCWARSITLCLCLGTNFVHMLKLCPLFIIRCHSSPMQWPTHPGEKCSKMLGMVEVLRISTLKAHQVGRTHQPLHHGCAAAVSRTSWLLTWQKGQKAPPGRTPQTPRHPSSSSQMPVARFPESHNSLKAKKYHSFILP